VNDRLRGEAFGPLIFEEGEIGKFIQSHRCSMCRGHLVGNHEEDRKWSAYCPNCEAVCYSHNVTSIHTIEHIQGLEAETRHMNREHHQVDPDKNIKELGF